MRVFKTIISGGYGLYNFGDDALMYAIYKNWQDDFRAKKLVFLCLKPSYLKKLVPHALVISRFSMSVVQCENFVLGGGTLFYSFVGEQGTTSGKFLAKMLNNLLNFRSAINKLLIKTKILKIKYEPDLYKNIYSLGIGLGPFDNGLDRKKQYAMDFCRKAKWLSVRDTKSMEYLKEWEIKENVLGSDICFLPNIFEIPKVENRSIKRIGIIIRDWDKNENGRLYKEQILASLPNLRDNYEVVFVVFSLHSDTSWIKTLTQLNEEVVTWNPDSQTITSFLKILNEFDLLITARYHGFIFASLLNIPSILIEIEPKLALAHKCFISSSFLWSYPFSQSELLDSISNITTNKDVIKAQLSTDVQKQAEAANYMFKKFESQIDL